MQLGLAEEFKKPIINVRVEEVSEIDPGLKLIIQRRQVLPLDYNIVPCCTYVCTCMYITNYSGLTLLKERNSL